jgi:hypothetical protein
MNAPYLLTGALLVTVALIIRCRTMFSRNETAVA